MKPSRYANIHLIQAYIPNYNHMIIMASIHNDDMPIVSTLDHTRTIHPNTPLQILQPIWHANGQYEIQATAHNNAVTIFIIT